MTDQVFARAMHWLLRPDVEGDEANHPADRGGHTKYGMADAADGKKDGLIDLDRDGVGDVAVSEVTHGHAGPYYRQHYWQVARCHQVAPLCPLLAIALFDAAVHHGPGRAVKLLQQALAVTVDGQLGPKSLSALAAQSRVDGGEALLLRLLTVRAGFMLGIVRSDPSQWANAHGWCNRLLRLQQHLLAVTPLDVA